MTCDRPRSAEQEKPDDPKLRQRFEVERVCVLGEEGTEFALLEPPRLPRARAAADERMLAELGDRNTPELPTAAA